MVYKLRLNQRAIARRLPVETFRTAEQHRAILEKMANAIISSKSKEAKARAKKERRLKRQAIKAVKKAKPAQRRITAAEYRAYIASDQWTKTKERWMNSPLCRGRFCHANGCGADRNLQMHHRTYKRLGREDMNDLVLVCGSCHLKIHELHKSGVKLLEASRRIVGY